MRRRRGRNPALVGALTLAVIIVASYLGFTKDIPFVNPPFEIQAAFTDSSGIRTDSPVRIAGVDVGEVTEIKSMGGPHNPATVVTMDIKDNGRPIHQDAEMKIRPRIFLEGNFFVEVRPGTPGSPELEEGEMIPVSRTENPVQFDEVLKILKEDSRENLRQIFAELLFAQKAGAGEAFNESLEDQSDAYRYTAVVFDALRGENPGDLGDFIRDQGVVAGALVEDPEQLRDLIVNFDTTAGALADREADLRDAVDTLPRVLREAMPTFDALNAALPSVSRFAEAARPGVRSTGPTARALLPLLRQLRGLVSEEELRGLSADLREATPSLAALAQESVPMLEQLRLVGSCSTNVLTPFGNSTVGDPNFPAKGPAHQELAQALSGLAGESRSFDANGQWFKVLGTGGVETFNFGGLAGNLTFPATGLNPPVREERPPLRPDVPCETQEPPDLDSNPQDPPEPMEVDRDDPELLEREAMAREVAMEVLARRQRAQGQKVRKGEGEVTMGAIENLARQRGLMGQLDALRSAARQGRVMRP
ncbi:MAG: MlaD family protein [Actinomycetota bacterium]|nr:MlaD family protein [Actinomycetota bacterium]